MRLIDADKLEELCDIMADKCGEIGDSIWNQFRTMIECSPTVDGPEKKVGKWIPVSERLPEKYTGEWLCCDKYGNIYILQYDNIYPNGNCVFCYTDYDGYSVHVDDIVAWMSLPKPWRVGEDG